MKTMAIGRRVRIISVVYTIKGRIVRPGFATYLGDVRMGSVVVSNIAAPHLNVKTPKFRLDSGEIVFGFMCWWTPVLLPMRLPTCAAMEKVEQVVSELKAEAESLGMTWEPEPGILDEVMEQAESSGRTLDEVLEELRDTVRRSLHELPEDMPEPVRPTLQ